MLDGLRKASQNWFGKTMLVLIMGFLTFSFVIWGIGDIFRGFGGTSLAKVGQTEISSEAFRSAYQIQLQRLQQQARRVVTAEQAKAMGLDSQVLGKLISDAALDERARTLGLAMSNADIVKSAASDPAFFGASGRFDPLVFQSILRDNGLTEKQFVADQRGVYLRREIADALAGGIVIPNVALEAVNRFRNETRSVDYFVLPAKAAGTIPAPSAADLQKFYDDRKLTWRAPDYRKLVVLAITPETLSDPKAVTEADARARYDKVKDRFGTPEARDIQQVLFNDEASAKAAADKIAGGATFESVVADNKLSIADLGLTKKADLFDKSIAEAAFALPLNKVSAPVKGQLGFLLIRVSKIEPAQIKPFEDVQAQVTSEVALERARTSIITLHDQIEDQRASGKPLADAAKVANLSVQVVDAVDANGRDKTNTQVALPEREALLKAAFASDIGVDNDVLASRAGGYVWFEVAAIEPSRQRTLDEVKADVEAAWREDETAKKLSDAAINLAKQIEAGADMAALAKANGDLSVIHVSDVKRLGTTSVAPPIVNAVFNVKVGAAGTAAGEGQTRAVFKVLDSVVPVLDADSDVSKAVTGELRQQMTEDMLSSAGKPADNDGRHHQPDEFAHGPWRRAGQ